MPDTFEQILEKSVQTPEGAIATIHLTQQIGILNKMYDNVPTRDAAFILATDWVENGSPLRKAAAAHWARDKKITSEDKPDPNAKQPEPSAMSDGVDAPESAAGAAGTGERGKDATLKPEDKMQQGKVKGGSFYSKLRQVVGKAPMAPAAGGHRTVDAAYEAGRRDATKEHAGHVHRVGRTAARHAFQLGTEAGAKMAQRHQERGNQALPLPTQQVVTHPGAFQKADLEALLAKARA
jgi:hypothetical protein